MGAKRHSRLLTIAVTAALTSAAWVLVGILVLDCAPNRAIQPAASKGGAGFAPLSATLDKGIAAPANGRAGLIIPVEGVRPEDLTDSFGDERGDGARRHPAIDIMAAAGTPVLAAAAGTVEALFQSEDGGNTIYIRLPDRKTIHYYAHLAAYAPGLGEGQQVSQGEVLGTVGSTGSASSEAPHLHFEIMRTVPEAEWWEPSTPVNPYPLLTEGRRVAK